MEMSLLSWLALLAFYMLYILLGGCMFSHIEHQKDSWDSEEEAERSREIKEPYTYDVRKILGLMHPSLPLVYISRFVAIDQVSHTPVRTSYVNVSKVSPTYDVSEMDPLPFPYPCLQRNASEGHICMVPQLVIVDLLAQVLLKERSPTNITSVLDRIRDLSAPKIHNFSSKIKVLGASTQWRFYDNFGLIHFVF